MISSTTSHLLKNILRYNLDSRIGRFLLNLSGTGTRIGERVSVKPGHSPEILDYRHYRDGDPIKDIDWKLSARQEQLLLKIREGYRQSEFLIVIDGSESMQTSYGSNQPIRLKNNDAAQNTVQAGEHEDHSKFIRALTLAYIAGRIALKSRDRVFILWENRRVRVDSEQMLLKTLLDLEKSGRTFDFWEGELSAAANCFILSDFFIETPLLHSFLERLTLGAKKIFILAIQDPVEKELRFADKNKFFDPERNPLNPGRRDMAPAALLVEVPDIQKQYQAYYKEHFISVAQICKTFGIRAGLLSTAEDPFQSFIRAVL